MSLEEFTKGMRKVGHDPSKLEKRAKRLMEQNKEAMKSAKAAHVDEDVDMDGEGVRAGATARGARSGRFLAGMATQAQADKATELRKFAQREPARLAKASESDRHVPITRPKWMLAGKRKAGKTQRR